jgi:hypothetical protein
MHYIYTCSLAIMIQELLHYIHYAKHVLSLMPTPARIIFSHTYQESAKN